MHRTQPSKHTSQARPRGSHASQLPTVLGEMVAMRLRMSPRLEIGRASTSTTPPSRLLLLVDCMLDGSNEGPEEHLCRRRLDAVFRIDMRVLERRGK